MDWYFGLKTQSKIETINFHYKFQFGSRVVRPIPYMRTLNIPTKFLPLRSFAGDAIRTGQAHALILSQSNLQALMNARRPIDTLQA